MTTREDRYVSTYLGQAGGSGTVDTPRRIARAFMALADAEQAELLTERDAFFGKALEFKRKRIEALACADAAEATLARVRGAVAEHPDPCPEVDIEAGISCGWKRAFQDVHSALTAFTD